MIVFNGHGSDKSITGHNDHEIVKCGINDYLLKERPLSRLFVAFLF